MSQDVSEGVVYRRVVLQRCAAGVLRVLYGDRWSDADLLLYRSEYARHPGAVLRVPAGGPSPLYLRDGLAGVAAGAAVLYPWARRVVLVAWVEGRRRPTVLQLAGDGERNRKGEGDGAV